MQLTRSEENKNRIISGTISLLIFALIILFLIWFKLVRPNPPFPESGGGGGQELALGMVDMGKGDIDFGNMGSVTDVVAETTPVESPQKSENIVTDPGGENVAVEAAKPEVKNNTTVIKPVKPAPEKPREKTEAEKMAEKFKKSTGKEGGGHGDNEQAGDNGKPDGDPFKNGAGGHGTGTGTGDGEGGPGGNGGPGTNGTGGSGSKFGIDLRGRAVVVPPKIPSDTKAEGKVVVEITVDSKGNVIEANPNGRGTTTSDAMLKAKARQAALNTKFNVNEKFEEQRGTITFIFAFD